MLLLHALLLCLRLRLQWQRLEEMLRSLRLWLYSLLHAWLLWLLRQLLRRG